MNNIGYKAMCLLFFLLFSIFFTCCKKTNTEAKNNIINETDFEPLNTKNELFLYTYYGDINTQTFFELSDDDHNIIIDNEDALSWVNIYNVSNPCPFTDSVVFSMLYGDNRIKYISYLENNPYVVLDDNEYYMLTKERLNKKYGLLIRAVHLQFGGYFSVAKNKCNEYLVTYLVMGSGIFQRGKAIIALELDELPNNIYVEYLIIQ